MRRPIAKRLSDLLPGVLKPALEQHGLATSQIITRWRDIAGEDLNLVTRPLRINWPRQDREGMALKNPSGATLVLLVESAFALDAQHAAPLILERINAFYGWQAVTKITLRQGPVGKEKDIQFQEFSEDKALPVTGVEDAPLRDALQKLGKAVARTPKN